MVSAWITFVKAWAIKNKMKYNEALKSPKLKADWAKEKKSNVSKTTSVVKKKKVKKEKE